MSIHEHKARILDEWISSRVCSDHNGKWERGNGCLLCKNDALALRLAEAERLLVDMVNLHELPDEWMGQYRRWRTSDSAPPAHDPSLVYYEPFAIVAVDAAGNESPPAMIDPNTNST